MLAALLDSLGIWSEHTIKFCTPLFAKKIHTRIVRETRLRNKNFHSVLGLNRKWKERQLIFAPFIKPLQTVGILERVVELSVKLFSSKSYHIRDKRHPVLPEVKLSLLGNDFIFLCLAESTLKPVGHAVVIRPEHESKLFEQQRYLIIIIPHFSFLVGDSRESLV